MVMELLVVEEPRAARAFPFSRAVKLLAVRSKVGNVEDPGVVVTVDGLGWGGWGGRSKDSL